MRDITLAMVAVFFMGLSLIAFAIRVVHENQNPGKLKVGLFSIMLILAGLLVIIGPILEWIGADRPTPVLLSLAGIVTFCIAWLVLVVVNLR